MTDYIEDMMKTAGLKKECIYHFKTENNHTLVVDKKRDLISFIKDYKLKGRVVKTTMTPKTYFPYFTAEKQLEIIKLISASNSYMDIEIGVENGIDYCVIFCVTNTNVRYEGYNQDFTQALAHLTTELMKAGELDKSKVKEILNV